MFWKKHKIRTSVEEDESLWMLDDSIKNKDLQPQLEHAKVLKMKNHLMTQIDTREPLPSGLEKIALQLQKVGDSTQLSPYLTTKLKIKLMDAIEASTQRFSWRVFSVNLFRGAILGVLVMFGFTFIFPSKILLTKASHWTYLEQVSGEVFVKRNGKLILAQIDFGLQEGDIIITRETGFAVIRFLDDSLSRLGENTQIQINKIDSGFLNSFHTQVEIQLDEGYLWATVVNLLDNQSAFEVNTLDARAKVQRRAAFEVHKQDKLTSLRVFDNAVDFSSRSNTVEQVQPILAGYNAQIISEGDSSNSFSTLPNHAFVVKADIATTRNSWENLNLTMDAQHGEKILLENQQLISDALRGDSIFTDMLNVFQEKTKGLFLDPGFAHTKNTLLEAQIAFINAQKTLLKNDPQQRQKALKDLYKYRTNMQSLITLLPELRQKNSQEVDVLLKAMVEHNHAQRKALTTVLPSDNLYLAKQFVNDIAPLLAQTDYDKLQVSLDLTTAKLLEVQVLVAKNRISEAVSNFDNYAEQMSGLAVIVTPQNFVEFQNNLFHLIDGQIRQIELLISIEQSLTFKNRPDFVAKVQGVQDESIEKLIAIFKTLKKGSIPFNYLQQLQSLVKNYMDEGASRTKAIDELLEIMNDYPQFEFLKAVELKSDNINKPVQENLFIQEQEATPDLGVE